MARVKKVEKLTISTQNVVPQLAETPLNDAVMMVAAGAPAIPTDDFIVNGKTITWDNAVAGYNLENGDTVVVDYEYDDGSGPDAYPYSPTDEAQNPVTTQYNLTVIVQNTTPKIIHIPVVDSLVVRVNDVLKTENVHWSLSGRTINWISGTTLNVGDIVNVFYRISA